MIEYKCYLCDNPASFYIRIAKKLRPVCVTHYNKIKTHRAERRIK